MTFEELHAELEVLFNLAPQQKMGLLDKYRSQRLVEACENIADALHRSSRSVWVEAVDGKQHDVGGLTRPDLDDLRWKAGL